MNIHKRVKFQMQLIGRIYIVFETCKSYSHKFGTFIFEFPNIAFSLQAVFTYTVYKMIGNLTLVNVLSLIDKDKFLIQFCK